MKAFFDSSAFAKRYIEEKGSHRVQEVCLQSSKLAVSVICIPEIISALCRLVRGENMTQHQYQKAKEALIQDLKDVIICDITPSVIGRFMRLLERNPIRAMDALHIACSLEWRAEVFVSSDHQQIKAAKNSRLQVLKI